MLYWDFASDRVLTERWRKPNTQSEDEPASRSVIAFHYLDDTHSLGSHLQVLDKTDRRQRKSSTGGPEAGLSRAFGRTPLLASLLSENTPSDPGKNSDSFKWTNAMLHSWFMLGAVPRCFVNWHWHSWMCTPKAPFFQQLFCHCPLVHDVISDLSSINRSLQEVTEVWGCGRGVRHDWLPTDPLTDRRTDCQKDRLTDGTATKASATLIWTDRGESEINFTVSYDSSCVQVHLITNDNGMTKKH